MNNLQKEFESKGCVSWINSDLYPDGKIYTKEYTEWLESRLKKRRQKKNKAEADNIDEKPNELYAMYGVMPSLLSLNFREMRKAKGLTLRKVEETTGISNAYLSQLETGKIKSPGYETVKLLYDLYSNEA